jgi:hypothetical protein
MKITKKNLLSLGFESVEWNSIGERLECHSYPFNQMDFYWTREGLKIKTADDTKYSCTTFSNLLSSVYFAGIHYGHKQKAKQIREMLGINE